MTLLVALVAILLQPQPIPPSFAEYMLSGHPVVVDGFIGWEWQCAPNDDESCYAGWDLSSGLVTGP